MCDTSNNEILERPGAVGGYFENIEKSSALLSFFIGDNKKLWKIKRGMQMIRI